MRLFSDFVAAGAETSQPVIKKEPPKERPLHFKYYQNDGEGENQLTEDLTDSILGKASNQLNKKQPKLIYDHSDPGWGVTPIQPVDYSKSKKDKELLYEPLQNVDVQDVPQVVAQMEKEEQQRNKKEDTVELSV